MGNEAGAKRGAKKSPFRRFTIQTMGQTGFDQCPPLVCNNGLAVYSWSMMVARRPCFNTGTNILYTYLYISIHFSRTLVSICNVGSVTKLTN